MVEEDAMIARLKTIVINTIKINTQPRRLVTLAAKGSPDIITIVRIR